MSMDSVPLGEALKSLIKQGQLNVVLDPKISGVPMANTPSVSGRWNKVTARQAIVALCVNYDLMIVKDAAGGGVTIKPRD